MIFQQSIYQTFQRYRVLKTHRITALPIVILMPHSACNCRCIMCDIWKDNKNLKQLSEADVRQLLVSLKRLGTKQVVMSGGEALLNPNFFRLCEILREQYIRITVLSTGLLLRKHAHELIRLVNEVIVSLDGNEAVHDQIRNSKGAYSRLKEGVQYLKAINPSYRISSRTVIHRLNFRIWPHIIASAKEMGLDKVSFLPADVTSSAFNRDVVWEPQRQNEVALVKEELEELQTVILKLTASCRQDFKSGFIAESPEKIKAIYTYYAALHGLCNFPHRKCNAPWVSTVIEADGKVRPCFFHDALGSIHEDSLTGILNGEKGVVFRENLNIEKNETCKKCVCSLHLPVWVNPSK